MDASRLERAARDAFRRALEWAIEVRDSTSAPESDDDLISEAWNHYRAAIAEAEVERVRSDAMHECAALLRKKGDGLTKASGFRSGYMKATYDAAEEIEAIVSSQPAAAKEV